MALEVRMNSVKERLCEGVSQAQVPQVLQDARVILPAGTIIRASGMNVKTLEEVTIYLAEMRVGAV